MEVRIDPTLTYLSHLNGCVYIFTTSVYTFQVFYQFFLMKHKLKYIS